MEVILRQDVEELGLEGDIVKVAKGYARNYLIPQSMALEASEHNRKALELQRKKIELKRVRVKEEAEKVKTEMEEVVVTISQKAGEEGKLYGSVTSMDVASQLKNQGIDIDRRKIVMEKPIKELGEFEVGIKIYPEVSATIKVVVKAEEEAPEE
ncbi:MAG: 50S ribosomal protein L9 [Deltaproteobacteria bacterium]|nr:50S ribosomal protein L9 [Deltaproteobacteria bacterium]